MKENDANLSGAVPTFSFSAAGANAVIDRPLVVDNGAVTASGVPLSFSLLARLSPLSNATGSQTLTGGVTLNTNVNLQGGGAGNNTGATNFSGAVSGVGAFYIPNGRVNFTATSTLTNTGGYVLGNSGNSAQVSFLGATSGTVPVTVNGGNSTTVSYAAGSLPQGPLTVQSASGSTAPSLIPLAATSTINNQITLSGDAIANVGTGIAATWAGPLSGTGALTKTGAGTLTLSAATSTYAGALAVNAGTLSVTGSTQAASATVNSGGLLQGSGTLVAPVTVATGGAIKGGTGIGTLTVAGNVALTAATTNPAILQAQGDNASNSTIRVTGAASTLNLAGLTGSNLLSITLSGTGLTQFSPVTWELARTVDNPAGVQVNGVGSFGVVPPASYAVTSPDFQFTSVTLTANPNTLVIVFTPVPEPGWLVLTGAVALGAVRLRRRAAAFIPG